MLDFDDGEDVKWNGFLKMKIAFKVDEPLKIGFNLKMNNRSFLEVSFKYERLLGFCYFYGRLGHIDTDCYNQHDSTNISIREDKVRDKHGEKRGMEEDEIDEVPTNLCKALMVVQYDRGLIARDEKRVEKQQEARQSWRGNTISIRDDYF
ncbi:hypothetical protein REPUB_Repub07fG0161300 [Reevesia pubescens]